MMWLVWWSTRTRQWSKKEKTHLIFMLFSALFVCFFAFWFGPDSVETFYHSATTLSEVIKNRSFHDKKDLISTRIKKVMSLLDLSLIQYIALVIGKQINKKRIPGYCNRSKMINIFPKFWKVLLNFCSLGISF